MFHTFIKPVSSISIPDKFTYPFQYTPHLLCEMAAEEVQCYLRQQVHWEKELKEGKMFGVLIVVKRTKEIGFLAAFSGILAGSYLHPYFVPPIYDLQKPEGFFKKEETLISAINAEIEQLQADDSYFKARRNLDEMRLVAQKLLADAKTQMKLDKEKRERLRQNEHLTEDETSRLIRESQFQKAELKRLKQGWSERIEALTLTVKIYEDRIEGLKVERKVRSAALQQQLFEQFHLLNARGEVKDLCSVFEETAGKVPPGGAGECAAPKLLQYAYLNQLKPVAMAEFWWGNSPKTEIRHHGYYYPACKGKCEPILKHMLQGLDVEENPLLSNAGKVSDLEILWEDAWLLVVYKPAGMLSVPGKLDQDSVYQRLRSKYPDATGPMIVHRLDMATSGLLLVAKTKEIHQKLQILFENRQIKKRYIALLDGVISTKEGYIDLPICLDPLDRPRQIVSEEYGKLAVTNYQVLGYTENKTRVAFYPITGRTHQLRVHASHPLGLNAPIVGDELYGKKAKRLYLHAELLEFIHPFTKELVQVEKKAEF